MWVGETLTLHVRNLHTLQVAKTNLQIGYNTYYENQIIQNTGMEFLLLSINLNESDVNSLLEKKPATTKTYTDSW